MMFVWRDGGKMGRKGVNELVYWSSINLIFDRSFGISSWLAGTLVIPRYDIIMGVPSVDHTRILRIVEAHERFP